MLGQVKGNYELRIAIVNLSDEAGIATSGCSDVHNQMEDTDFYSLAEHLGTIYSLGTFINNVNDQELDNFSDSYVRAFLVNTNDPEEIIGIDDFNSLYLYEGEIKQV